MALTKLPKNALGTGSVDASKIEDGTIQNQELAGSLSEDKLATGTIENASLSNSTITINGTSISLGGSSSVGVDVNWQSVITGAGSSSTAVAGNGYFIDTTSDTHTLNLPASASLGDQIAIKDYAGTFASNNLTIGRNGHNIQGVANDSLISTNRASLLLVYVDSTKGWIYAEESNVDDLSNVQISATGGTITESGDFKIHTFTGDGCFVVSSIKPASPSKVDYLVVAGGGGGGNGAGGAGGAGAGAGGYRTTFPNACSPTGGSFTITASTYPITVGGGGSSYSSGSNSIFSTITSTGGGFGASPGPGPAPNGNGGSGGSGGGAAYNGLGSSGTAGSGNTPPVSPPQGNNGGGHVLSPGGGGDNSGGGGGASEVGQTSPGVLVSGRGGAGSPNSISGSALSYSGGGGGGGRLGDGIPAGAGSPCGTGGAGNANGNGTAGTTNRGGGGGGSSFCNSGGAGGSGIVIIRYKFQ